MKRFVIFMAALVSCGMEARGDQCRRSEEKPMNRLSNRFLGFGLLRGACAIVSASLTAVLVMTSAPCAYGQTYYEMTVHNNFGTGEFYNATPTEAQIWLLTNFQFDYMTAGSWTTGNGTAGSMDVRQTERHRPGQDTNPPHERGHPHVRNPEQHPAPGRAAGPHHSSALQLLRVEF